MAEYLACYDYGMGGVWLYVDAENQLELSHKYPALMVFETQPTWWSEEMERTTRANHASEPQWQKWLEKISHETMP